MTNENVKNSAQLSSNETDEIISMNDAIEILKTTRSTFYRWLRSGKIKGMKVAHQWRFYRKDIESFLKGQELRIDLPMSIQPLISRLREYADQSGIKNLPESDDELTQAINLMIHLAIKMRVSDIHLAPHIKERGLESIAVLRYRIDGVLHTIADIDVRLLPAIVEKWKSMASCDVHEKEKPQDGRILTEIDNKQIDLRASFLPTGLGESITVRIFDQHVTQVKLEDIDYAPHDRERLLRAIESPNGMIIISGPTGSGKTTVIYACLNHISSPERKTMTVESPIEYYMPWIVQVPVNLDAGVTFPIALRSILRSDPDVIGIMEIRDLETLEIAQQCALTGHLVISQMHAGEAVRVLNRMVGMGAEPFIIGESTKLIVCHRLVRKLCPFCNEEQNPPADILEKAEKLAFANGLDWNQLQKTFHSPVGCAKCGNTGYRGRNVIAETLEMTPEITIALGQNASIEELQSIAIKQGMTSIAADGLKRASMGMIPLSEVLRVLSLR